VLPFWLLVQHQQLPVLPLCLLERQQQQQLPLPPFWLPGQL
jgi:hypothetical protein